MGCRWGVAAVVSLRRCSSPQAIARVHFLRARSSFRKRAFLLAVLVAITSVCQRSLDARGDCLEFLRTAPPGYEDPIQDHAFELTAGLNAVMFDHPWVAGGLQAICSASLDASMVMLLIIGFFRRSSIRPFLAMFLLMMLRFVAQSVDVMVRRLLHCLFVATLPAHSPPYVSVPRCMHASDRHRHD